MKIARVSRLSLALCAGAIAVVLVASACASPAPPAPTQAPAPATSPAAAATIKILSPTLMSAQTVYGKIHVAWGDEVKKATGGRVTVQTTTYAELGLTGFEGLSRLKAGQLQMTEGPSMYLSQELPIAELISMPVMFKDVWYDGRFATEIAMQFLKPELDQFDAYPLMVHTWSPTLIGTVKEFKTLDDLKGRKIRTVGTLWADFVKAFGGVPVSAPFADVYTNLERGILDGVLAGGFSTQSAKWQEVLKYQTSQPYLFQTNTVVFIKKSFLESLPLDLQGILIRTAKDVSDRVWAEEKSVEENAIREMLEKKQLTQVPMTDTMWAQIQQVSVPLWKTWADKFGARGHKLLQMMAGVAGAKVPF